MCCLCSDGKINLGLLQTECLGGSFSPWHSVTFKLWISDSKPPNYRKTHEKDNHLFLKWQHSWKKYLMVRSWHIVVFSRTLKVILFWVISLITCNDLVNLEMSFYQTGKYSSLQQLFNVCHMPGICSVQETKTNSLSSRRLRCKVGEPPRPKILMHWVSPAEIWTRCCSEWRSKPTWPHGGGFLEEMMAE